MTQYANFRQRLDAVLRTLDIHNVREFLIAKKQWQPGQPANPEFAMWMATTQYRPVSTISLNVRIFR